MKLSAKAWDVIRKDKGNQTRDCEYVDKYLLIQQLIAAEENEPEYRDILRIIIDAVDKS